MNKDVTGSLAWGLGIMAVALGARYAREHGYVDPDSATRIVASLIGLMVAWFGNRMPKAFVPVAWARQLRRVAGWSMAVSGLVYAALWAFAPIPVATVAGCGAIIVGMAVSVGYCFVLRAKAKAA